MTTQQNGSDRRWVADVVVMPKTGVNDPQGEAIHGGVRSLGFASVDRVRSGRFFRLLLSSPDADVATADATALCERLLANPVIETFTVSVRPEDDER